MVVRLRRPVIYQDTEAGRQPIEGGYVLDGGRVRFQLAAWDAVHWHEDAVVSRPFAEWCGTLDLVLGVGVLVVVLR